MGLDSKDKAYVDKIVGLAKSGRGAKVEASLTNKESIDSFKKAMKEVNEKSPKDSAHELIDKVLKIVEEKQSPKPQVEVDSGSRKSSATGTIDSVGSPSMTKSDSSNSLAEMSSKGASPRTPSPEPTPTAPRVRSGLSERVKQEVLKIESLNPKAISPTQQAITSSDVKAPSTASEKSPAPKGQSI